MSVAGNNGKRAGVDLLHQRDTFWSQLHKDFRQPRFHSGQYQVGRGERTVAKSVQVYEYCTRTRTHTRSDPCLILGSP